MGPLIILATFPVLLGIGLKWQELNWGDAALVVLVWVGLLGLIYLARPDLMFLWMAGVTVLVDAYLILRIFKSDPIIPRGTGLCL